MTKDINYFESSREVKWCPGCGNYAILKAMQKTMHNLKIPREKVVFVSGIGCSGRFPYYINTYGFHTLHGRAPAVATGLSLARPDLTIWVVIGDGDGFSIGLSHVLHMIRRNVNVNVLFINNRVYALTKGQYSPTSEKGFVTKSSPYGSIEDAINPLSMVLSANCTFVARAVDNDFKNLSSVISDAISHQGLSFIEVLQNCNIFNNSVYLNISDTEKKKKNVLYLKHNENLFFGENNEFCLDLSGMQLTVKSIDAHNKTFIKHDILKENIIQTMLAKISYNETPFPVGIFRAIKKHTFNEAYLKTTYKSKKINTFTDLFL